MKTTITATKRNTTVDHKGIRSQHLPKYIRNVQQANKGTAAQYEYRLSKFEEYVGQASEEEPQEPQQQNRANNT